MESQNQAQSDSQWAVVAEAMYKWYGDHADWKNFQGNRMPEWHELPKDIRGHWIFVAEKFLGVSKVSEEALLRLSQRALILRRGETKDAAEGRRCSLAITKVEEALLWLKSGSVGVG